MVAMNLNSPTYALLPTASSAPITLAPQDTNQSSLQIYNDDADFAVAVVSGSGSAPTAAFPTSATDPVNCKVIPPKGLLVYSKNINHSFISIVSQGSASGYTYVSVGAGE